MVSQFEQWWGEHRRDIGISDPLQQTLGAFRSAWHAGRDAGYLQGVREAQEKAGHQVEVVGSQMVSIPALDGWPMDRSAFPRVREPRQVSAPETGDVVTPGTYY